MQTKSNLWAGATIWANLAIVFIVYAIVYAGVNYLFNQQIDYNGSFSPWQPLWESINPALIFFLSIFAIYLGARSVFKVTPVDPQNIVRISFYSVLVPLLLQLVAILVSIFYYGFIGPTFALSIALYLASDAFIFASCFYFLKRHQKREDETPSISSKFGLIGVIILLIIAIPLGIIRYQAQVVAQQAYHELLKSIQNELDKSVQNQAYAPNTDVDESLKEARDAQRINDLQALSTAVSLYLTSVNAVDTWSIICAENKLYRSIDGTKAVDGTGWLPIDLSKIPGGSPFFELSTDPLQTPSSYYSFKCSNSLEYEFDAKFESQKYGDSAKNDHGNNPNLYEVGSSPGLELIP